MSVRPGPRRPWLLRRALAEASAFEAAPEAAALCRGDGRVLALNGAARHLFGGHAARGLALSHLVGKAGSGPLAAAVGRPPVAVACRAPGGGLLPLELRIRRLATAPRTLYAAYLRSATVRGGEHALADNAALVATLAHELNNPLAILLAQATVLRDVAPDADIARRAERIEEAARRAGRVLSGLLSTCREPKRPSRAPLAPPGGGCTPAPPPLRLTVLVVDDDQEVASSLAELLALAGHSAVVETSPAAALERVTRCRFDVVFADLRMPGLDGLALRDALGQLDPDLADRTVIVTGDTVSRDGGLDHAVRSPVLKLGKPFTMAGLKDVLERVGRL